MFQYKLGIGAYSHLDFNLLLRTGQTPGKLGMLCDGHSLCAYTSAGSGCAPPPEKFPVEDTGSAPGKKPAAGASLGEPGWREFSG